MQTTQHATILRKRDKEKLTLNKISINILYSLSTSTLKKNLKRMDESLRNLERIQRKCVFKRVWILGNEV